LFAFVAVALLGIAVLALLVAGGLRAGAGRIAEDERNAVAEEVAALAGQAYAAAGSWAAADLGAAQAAAGDAGAALAVRDAGGAAVTGAGPGAGVGAGRNGETGAGRNGGNGGAENAASGGPTTAPVSVDGEVVGTVVLRFPGMGTISDRTLALLWLWIALAAAAALVVAVAAAALVIPRITRPLRELAGAVERVGRGERDPALEPEVYPGELGAVATAVASLAEDLDDQQRLRKAALADVTHELRTPVAVLQAHLEEMLDGVGPPDVQQLALLHDEVLRIGRLMEDLETLREAETSRLSLRTSDIDLADVAAGACDALAGRAAEEGVAIARQLDHAPTSADPDRLTQVALNLLGNALKYGGGTTVTVRTAPGDDARAVLEVVDHGPGIASEDLPHVFDRYWRAAAGGRTAGSGVGLAVVREIVTAHNGTVSACATPGGGTTFRVLV